MEIFIGIIVLTVMLCCLYIGAVVQEESKRKERIPLFWEKDGFLFDLWHKSNNKKGE